MSDFPELDPSGFRDRLDNVVPVDNGTLDVGAIMRIVQTGPLRVEKVPSGTAGQALVTDGAAWAPGDVVTDAGGVPSHQAGTRANQPAAGTAGRLYVVTDELVLERDNGTAWQQIIDLAHRNDAANPHAVTHAQVGAPSDNPHAVTHAQVGAPTGNPHGVTHAETNPPATNPHAVTHAQVGAPTGNPHAVTAAEAGAVANAGGAPSYQADTRANQPAAGTVGRFYYVTDEDVLEYDDGVAWVLIFSGTYHKANEPGARLSRSTNQAIADSTVTAIEWDGVAYDNTGGSMWDSGSATLLTFPEDGIYLVAVAVVWAGDDTGQRLIRVATAGGVVLTADRRTAIANTQAGASMLDSFAANDQVRLEVFQTSGASLDVRGIDQLFLSAQKVAEL